ncbi:MAG: N-acetyltransferase [Gemmatimonadetes bacterium]|nr:N-acetyltransferase [Gemmatimonadota bacterium]
MATEAGTATLEYRRDGDTLHLTHTEVPREDEGRGEGGRLVEHVLGWARTEGLHVVPDCPFVSSWIRRHPEHLDLVPEDWPGRERLVREKP